MKRISLLVLVGLIAGIIVGELAKASGNSTIVSAVEVIEAFGGLWLNTLRMTVVPLVVSLLIVGVASVADTTKTGGLVARAVLLFTFLLFLAGAFTTAATLGMLELWPVDRAAADAFVASVGGAAVTITEPPTFVSWLQGLAPSNPVTAAAEDAVLQVVVFSIFFGFAVTKLDAGLRDPIVTFFRAVSEAMIVIVRWVLIAGPFGVFALATGVGLRAGLDAATVLTQYVIIVSAATLGITIVAYLLAVTWGRQPIGRFTAASAPVWAIAVSTQSSLASLPAMLDAALRGLGIPARIADVVLPLAVAVFRFTSPVANLAVVYFCAHLYGIEPTFMQIGVGLVVAYAVSIAAVGLPGQVSFIASIAPICLAMGVPTELLGILIAVEIVPDIFRTLGNVTGDLAATSILSRKETRDENAA